VYHDGPLASPSKSPVPRALRLQERLRDSLSERIGDLSRVVEAKLHEELGVDPREAGPDRDVAQQLIEENFDLYLTQEEAFHELAQDILEDVRARFDFISAGELRRRPPGWPELWVFESADPDEVYTAHPVVFEQLLALIRAAADTASGRHPRARAIVPRLSGRPIPAGADLTARALDTRRTHRRASRRAFRTGLLW